jgi:integrase/recombinase XerD
MRRTALTNLSNAGVPLRVIMEISGHKNLSSLQRYWEVKPEQLVKAIGLLK